MLPGLRKMPYPERLKNRIARDADIEAFACIHPIILVFLTPSAEGNPFICRGVKYTEWENFEFFD